MVKTADAMLTKTCFTLLSKVLLLSLYRQCYGTLVSVSLSPHGDTPVCLVDYHLIVTCRATNLNVLTDTITWTITRNIEGRQSDSRSRMISAHGQRTITPITLNMNTFIFTNKTDFNSDTNLVTLTSNVSVIVTDYLNGTVIRCSTLDANSSVVFDTTTIYVIGNNSNSNVTLNESVSKTTSTNFTVTLSWEQDIGTHFSVHVVPDAGLNFTKTAEVQVTMSYNVSYMIIIVGTRCGQNVSRVVKEFNYVKCQNLQYYALDNPLVRVIGSNGPAIEGTRVTLECTSSELSVVQFGPNSTTCNSNGEWEPDPVKVKCKADCGVPSIGGNLTTYSTLQGSTIVYWCSGYTFATLCHRNGSWYPDPSENSLCGQFSGPTEKQTTLSNITFLIIISCVASFCVCILILLHISLIINCKQKCAKKSLSNTTQPIANSVKDSKTQELDMTENVAYGPLRSPQLL